MFPSSEGLQLCFKGDVKSVPEKKVLSLEIDPGQQGFI